MVFIVIDGLDASGKSTQAFSLSRFLEQKGNTVFVRVHPSSDNFLGARAKQFLYLKGKSAHFASALFYMFDVIRSILLYSWRRYDCMIFVRYLMGTAYLPSPLHKIAYHFFASVVPKSDYMFFLDVQPKEADRRIRETRRKFEMFENLQQLQRIRIRALSIAATGSWILVDGNKTIEQVQEQIREAL